jgi:hypothetical protein
MYSIGKYKTLLADKGWVEALQSQLPLLSDGILHTGPVNHYHYLLNGIGNLSPEIFTDCARLYVDSSYSDDQVEFLSKCVSQNTSRTIDIVRIPVGTYRVSNVVVPIQQKYDQRVKCIRQVVGSFVNAREKKATCLYVTRKNAGTRQLLNEEKVIERLLPYDVSITENEKLSIIEQVVAFSQAEFIVGPHGAGLTNAVFAKNPKGIMEFWHSVRQPFFMNLAKCLGCHHVTLRGHRATPGMDVRRIDNEHFTIDPDLAVSGMNLLRQEKKQDISY